MRRKTFILWISYISSSKIESQSGSLNIKLGVLLATIVVAVCVHHKHFNVFHDDKFEMQGIAVTISTSLYRISFVIERMYNL